MEEGFDRRIAAGHSRNRYGLAMAEKRQRAAKPGD
jgi:hypothetical protein